MIEVEAIRDRVDCREVADDLGVEFKRTSGKWWTCHCPLPGHADRNPSAGVGPDGWRCHGCGESGDAFDLYQQVCAVDFLTALDELAGYASFEFGTDRSDCTPRRRTTGNRKRKSSAEDNNNTPEVSTDRLEAARKTLAAVWERLPRPTAPHPTARTVASYLEGRSISPVMASREGLKAAGPELWRGIREGFDAAALEAAGLRNPESGALHPFWWWKGESLVLPYFGADGEIASLRFRRIFDDDGPKALGLRSSCVGQLHRPPLPFGAPDHVELAQGGDHPLYVVEGELDALSIWWECRRAVAAPGASSWPHQWCRGWEDLPAVVVLADGDDAGDRFITAVVKAAYRELGEDWVRRRMIAEHFTDGLDANDLAAGDDLRREIDRIEAFHSWPVPERKRDTEIARCAGAFHSAEPLPDDNPQMLKNDCPGAGSGTERRGDDVLICAKTDGTEMPQEVMYDRPARHQQCS